MVLVEGNSGNVIGKANEPHWLFNELEEIKEMAPLVHAHVNKILRENNEDVDKREEVNQGSIIIDNSLVSVVLFASY